MNLSLTMLEDIRSAGYDAAVILGKQFPETTGVEDHQKFIVGKLNRIVDGVVHAREVDALMKQVAQLKAQLEEKNNPASTNETNDNDDHPF